MGFNPLSMDISSGFRRIKLINIILNPPDIPEFEEKSTVQKDKIYNTTAENEPISLCYGRCKVGGNKLRFNNPDDSDLRIIIGHCLGEVEGMIKYWVNDVEWDDLAGSHTKTEYVGSRTQNTDTRFTNRASAYRGIAYTAFTFEKNDKQIGDNPNITGIMEGKLCTPLAGGSDVFTRNPAVILYDHYLNIEKKEVGDLDLDAFKSLEELCNVTSATTAIPKYRFDFISDVAITANDAKKLIWQSFNGQTIMSQGKIKPVWDSGQVADGSGGLTSRTVSHNFTEDNIEKDTFTWKQIKEYNVVRIKYKDPDRYYKETAVELKDTISIEENGEILYEEKAGFITNVEIAQERVRYKFNKAIYTDFECEFTAFTSAGAIELYDLVTVTHQTPGWTGKEFLVTGKREDVYGRIVVTLVAYHPDIYNDDVRTVSQQSYESDLPNPYKVPECSTNISAGMVDAGSSYSFDAVRVIFTPPATEPFYSYSEIFASNDDSNYYYVGNNSDGTFTFNSLGVIYEPEDTCYIKIRSVSDMGIRETMPGTYDTSLVITSTMKISGYTAGLNDLWGGNESISNTATTIVLGNLDGTPKVALGPSADAITVAGANPGFIADGTGKVYFGDGANKYFKYDGTNISWKGTNSELTAGGAFTATNATIEGTITATTGVIGGFTISSSDGLYSGSDNTHIHMQPGVGIWAGADNFVDADFRVNQAGELWATNANISGTLVVNKVHIPDNDATANSFHTNEDGDSWWGCTESDFIINYENANAYILKSGYAKFQDITLLNSIEVDHTNSDFFIINFDNTDIDTELRFGRATGGTASMTWNGTLVQCSKAFKSSELGINNISDTEPASPFAGQIWIDP